METIYQKIQENKSCVYVMYTRNHELPLPSGSYTRRYLLSTDVYNVIKRLQQIKHHKGDWKNISFEDIVIKIIQLGSHPSLFEDITDEILPFDKNNFCLWMVGCTFNIYNSRIDKMYKDYSLPQGFPRNVLICQTCFAHFDAANLDADEFNPHSWVVPFSCPFCNGVLNN